MSRAQHPIARSLAPAACTVRYRKGSVQKMTNEAVSSRWLQSVAPRRHDIGSRRGGLIQRLRKEDPRTIARYSRNLGTSHQRRRLHVKQGFRLACVNVVAIHFQVREFCAGRNWSQCENVVDSSGSDSIYSEVRLKSDAHEARSRVIRRRLLGDVCTGGHSRCSVVSLSAPGLDPTGAHPAVQPFQKH
jgi:hypothetical protein